MLPAPRACFVVSAAATRRNYREHGVNVQLLDVRGVLVIEARHFS
jgi:hypothetical protein